jgi:hypothetical protein
VADVAPAPAFESTGSEDSNLQTSSVIDDASLMAR